LFFARFLFKNIEIALRGCLFVGASAAFFFTAEQSPDLMQDNKKSPLYKGSQLKITLSFAASTGLDLFAN
jgi:hypothetical protein